MATTPLSHITRQETGKVTEVSTISSIKQCNRWAQPLLANRIASFGTILSTTVFEALVKARPAPRLLLVSVSAVFAVLSIDSSASFVARTDMDSVVKAKLKAPLRGETVVRSKEVQPAHAASRP